MSDFPLQIGQPEQPLLQVDCGCCEDTALSTPVAVSNRPNLTSILYRSGEHARFKASMLARLTSAEFAALQSLGIRDDDDFSITLIDAWASVCEVLSFYQERFANEAYMQTAIERLSIGEIARLIGYRLHPGAAAETDLVMLMDDPPGAEPGVADLVIPAGVRVQSQPGPDETPQVFETLEDLTAHVAWNSLRARQERRIAPAQGDIGTWLSGVATALSVGDAIVIVGRERSLPAAQGGDPGSEKWDFRRLVAVVPDAELDRTWVAWDRPLGSVAPPGPPAQADHRLFVLREQASLFGFNAPHPRVLSAEIRDGFGYVGFPLPVALPGQPLPAASPSRITGTPEGPGDWDFRFPTATPEMALDAVYKKFVSDGWVALTKPPGNVELYRITNAVDDGLSKYAISGRASTLTLDTIEGLSEFEDDYRRVSVYGASEEIALAATPLRGPIFGTSVELDTRAADLPVGRRLMFAGRRAQCVTVNDHLSIQRAVDDTRALDTDTRVTLLAPPQDIPGQTTLKRWRLRLADGYEGVTDARLTTDLLAVAADQGAEVIAELHELAKVVPVDVGHSQLKLSAALEGVFDRRDLRIHANVAPASHGENTTEILGGGDPERPFQQFILKQNPVTQRLAATENGVASTLTLRIDGVTWQEVPDLYMRGANARVFTTTLTDDGETLVQFGDGLSGARPPAGRDNILAEYRRGLGLAGNLRAGQLSLPLDRPLGLREVSNPTPATGGDDAESAAAARRNAPIYTLTLGRVVSVTDYRDFALGYPGIAKADARWIWDGETRRMVVTVAGPDGAIIAPGSTTYDALLAAFRELGDPFVQVDLLSYDPVYFRIGLRVAVAADRDTELVLANVETALRAHYAFAVRDFVQPVALSDVAALAHTVTGVDAVDIDRLYRTVAPQTEATAHSLLIAQGGRRASGGTLQPAELLTLSPDPPDSLVVLT